MMFVVVYVESTGDEGLRFVEETRGPFDGKDIADAEREVWETTCPDGARDTFQTPIEWLAEMGWRVVPYTDQLGEQIPEAT